MRPDIKAIAASGEKYNFHTHTQFCDGHDSIATMAQTAVANRFRHIGFTPHAPVPIESPCNMSANDVPAYFDEVRKVNDTYGDICRFYTGMEIDYLGPQCTAVSSYYRELGLDFTISSVHFIPDQSGTPVDIDGRYERFARNMREHFRNDLRYVVNTFFHSSMEMLATGGFDILGHFDKVAMNASYHQPDVEQQGWYSDLVDTYLDEIIKSGVVVEINTKAYDEHGRFFPHTRLWPALINSGITFVVNSDAHYATRLESSRDKAFSILSTMRDGR